jgi:hypothetical protein
LPAAAALVWFAGRYEADPDASFGTLRISATIGAVLFCWLVSAGIYALFLAASLRKGLLIAGIELLLMALLTALVAAIVLVFLSLVQITTRPPPARTGPIAFPAIQAASPVVLP